MIRIYCDSNIYRILAPSHLSHTSVLNDAFESLREKFIWCFSDAHLDDLKDSKKEFRDLDLKFMENYVKDNYFSYDYIKEKKFECFFKTPTEAFYDKDYDAARYALKDPFNPEHIFKNLGDDPQILLAKEKLEEFMSKPICSLTKSNNDLIIEEKHRKHIDLIIPGYHSGMTIGELMQAITPFSLALLEDDEKMTELRKIFKEYLNREHYSYEKWDMEFNEKFKESDIGKTFLEMIDSRILESQRHDFLHRFTSAYTMLEVYNVTEEKKKGGGLKKFDFESLNIDASHAFFASFCDYLVTDDRGLQVKANIVYRLFDLPTKVLSSNDFVEMKSLFERQEQVLDTIITAIKDDIRAENIVGQFIDENNAAYITYTSKYIYLNYFNRIQTVTNSTGSILCLFCERQSHSDFIMYREVEIIVQKLLDILGPDDRGISIYDFSENDNLLKGEILRQWSIKSISVSLIKGHGNFLCLCIDLHSLN